MTPPPLSIVQIGSFGSIGDCIYRVHEPAAALARLPDVMVHEVHPLARRRDAAALAADVLVLTMTLDVEMFRLIHQRRLLGKPTICEVNDYLPDVQTWNPAHRSWSDARGRRLFFELIRRCDATQVTTTALAERLAPVAPRVAIFLNQLTQLPPQRQFHPQKHSTVVLGWGGSAGHLHDLQGIAAPLIRWLQEQPRVRLEIMGDPALKQLFAGVPPEQFRFHRAGSLDHYLAWLGSLDIGLAPLLPTDYNRCRSDVKFLEYASRSVVPVLQRLDPYAAVQEGVNGFLFDNDQELVSILDRLVASPQLRCQVAAAGYHYVGRERRIDAHIGDRAAVYRELAERMVPSTGPLPELLQQAGSLPLNTLPGWEPVGANHWRLDVTTPAERHLAVGVEALQEGAMAEAAAALSEAVRLDPKDPHALSFLGHCLLLQGHRGRAQQAFEQAMALDPLLSRPVRALARLHRQAAAHYGKRAAALNPLGPGTTTTTTTAPLTHPDGF